MIDSEPSRSREPAIDRPKTLLYVDDHALDLALMRALLSQRPEWRLNMACDGEAACMIAKSEPHDLLLLDIRLPDGSGADVLRSLRALSGYSTVPAIAVTAEDFHEFREAGFGEVLPKPLNLRLTMRRLDHYLGEPAAVQDAGDVARPRDVPVPSSPIPLAPRSTSMIAGSECQSAAAVAGRLIERVKAQAGTCSSMSPAMVPVMVPAMRPAR